MRSLRLPVVLFVAATAWVLALLHRGFPLAWDEVEFFRATRWVAEGKVPFRDFWEHHLPLLWIAFAPVARFFGSGAGVDAVVAMRWAQLPVWCGVLAVAQVLARRAGVDRRTRWLVLVLLVTSGSFVFSALQYRVEALGALAFVGALLLAVRDRPAHWMAFGVLMSLSVLVNMRFAPLVVFTAAVMLAWSAGESRWRWNGRALWMIPGVAVTALLFVACLRLAGAWAAFLEGVIRYNTISNDWVEDVAGTFLPELLAPFRSGDVSGIALWLAALAGLAIAARDVRRPGPLQISALLFTASVAGIAMAGVHYPYHFVIAYVLMIPVAGISVQRLLAARGGELDRAALLAALPLVALLLQLLPLLSGSFGAGMAYQDRVMKEVDRLTAPGSRVWDGTGYALRREPAYRYWFLPAGVRFMAKERMIEPFDFEQVVARPPAAIVYNHRVHLWMLTFPRLGRYVVHHYLPLYRNLWVPGMSAVLEPGSPAAWIVPSTGKYEIWFSDLLPKHPWLARPMEYGMFQGEDAVLMQVPLERLPAVPATSLRLSVDGRPVPSGTRVLELRQGSRLEAVSAWNGRAGVIVAPAGVRTLFRAPEERFLF